MIQIALRAQRCGGGMGRHRHGVLRDYGPKGCLNGRPTDLSLHWQLVIRDNYKVLLATNHLILLWEWEPNVITPLWYTDPTPSVTKPRRQPERSKPPTFAQSRANDQSILIWSESENHLFPAATASLFP